MVFRASEPCKLNGYAITTANDNDWFKDRNPKDWKIYGSNDRNKWTELVTVSDDKKLQPEKFTRYEYTLNAAIATPYIYYKWEITANHSGENYDSEKDCQVSEFSISAEKWDWVKTDGSQGKALEYKYKGAIIPNDNISLENVSLVNIQKPNWPSAYEAGIYITFPGAEAFGEIRINGEETNYAKDGAGVCLFLSNFTEELTEVQVMDKDNKSLKWTLYVYYVKPVMVSASKKYVTPNAAVLKVEGKENANGDPVTRFKVVYDGKTNIYTARNGQITITRLNPDTPYTFDIYAVDAVGNESDNKISVEVRTLKSHPYPPDDPTYAPDKVFSIYSDTYTSKVYRVFSRWDGQTTEEAEVFLADSVRKALYYTNCNYLGWELNNNTTIGDMSHFPKLHMDIYVHEEGSIKFSPVWWGVNGSEEELKVYSLTQGWNALDIDLAADFAGIDLKTIFQLKWDALPAVCYIDNVYFRAEFFIIYHHDDMPAQPENEAVETFDGGEIHYPILYKRKFTPGVWETLCVPFKVDSITVYDPDDGKNYPLYAQYRNGETVYPGEFWLRTFDAVASAVTQADFQSNWQDIKAVSQKKALPEEGVPYIMRVPDDWDDYNDKYYYDDKYIVFHGAGGQEIAKTYTAPTLPQKDGYFSYSGNNTMKPWDLDSAYVLDAKGEYFSSDKPVRLHPFECAVYATKKTIQRSPRLRMSSPQITTDHGLPSTRYEGGRIYTTMGVLVGTFDSLDEQENCLMHLPEGIYIVQRAQAISKIHITR